MVFDSGDAPLAQARHEQQPLPDRTTRAPLRRSPRSHRMRALLDEMRQAAEAAAAQHEQQGAQAASGGVQGALAHAATGGAAHWDAETKVGGEKVQLMALLCAGLVCSYSSYSSCMVSGVSLKHVFSCRGTGKSAPTATRTRCALRALGETSLPRPPRARAPRGAHARRVGPFPTRARSGASRSCCGVARPRRGAARTASSCGRRGCTPPSYARSESGEPMQ